MSFPDIGLGVLQFLGFFRSQSEERLLPRDPPPVSLSRSRSYSFVSQPVLDQEITYWGAFYEGTPRETMLSLIRNHRMQGLDEADEVVGAFDSIGMEITPLQHSYRINNLDMVLAIENELIRSEINTEIDEDRFIFAIRGGDFRTVWRQILAGIDINRAREVEINRAIERLNPLQYAFRVFRDNAEAPQIQANLIEIIRLLLVHGAVLDAKTPGLLIENRIVDVEFLTRINSILHKAVSLQLGEFLRFMLKRGFNPNVLDQEGYTPLMRAAQLDWVDGVKILLAFKANFDIEKNGNTAETLAQGKDGKLIINIIRQARLDGLF